MKLTTRQLTVAGLMTAMTVLLGATQWGFVPLPTPAGAATIMHIPVIIAGMLQGPVIGSFVGLLFGISTIPFLGDLRVVIPARLFIGGVAMEWTSAEFGPGTPYGTAFFSMTGLHVSHLLSGLVVLVLVYRLGRRGSFSADDHWGATAAVRYWTFVDAMWLLVVFPTLYLL